MRLEARTTSSWPLLILQASAGAFEAAERALGAPEATSRPAVTLPSSAQRHGTGGAHAADADPAIAAALSPTVGASLFGGDETPAVTRGAGPSSKPLNAPFAAGPRPKAGSH
jgi:hypothetical protein